MEIGLKAPLQYCNRDSRCQSKCTGCGNASFFFRWLSTFYRSTSRSCKMLVRPVQAVHGPVRFSSIFRRKFKWRRTGRVDVPLNLTTYGHEASAARAFTATASSHGPTRPTSHRGQHADRLARRRREGTDRTSFGAAAERYCLCGARRGCSRQGYGGTGPDQARVGKRDAGTGCEVEGKMQVCLDGGL